LKHRLLKCLTIQSPQILKQFIEQIEQLEEEKQAIAESIKDVYQELKGEGFDVKIVREIIKLRKLDRDKLEEHDELIDLYKQAIGMI